MKNNKMDKEEIMKKINSVNWFHKFELCPGIVTPGKRAVNAKSFLDKRKIPSDLTGLKTLDIGTFDGPLSFELESRGAKSFAMDIQDPNVTGFNVAKEILDSDVDYKQGTVYDLKEMYGEEFFDIVCFKGVYYHLKNPVGAFEQVAAVLKTGGLCLVGGAVLISFAETLEGKRIEPSIVKQIAESEIPLTVCYPGGTKARKSSTIWFVPNIACIKSWLMIAGLELENYNLSHNLNTKYGSPMQRFVGAARKKTHKIKVEHGIKKKK